MIRGFRHKGLGDFYHTGNKAGIQAKHSERLRLILVRLDAANGPKDMNLPGLKMHLLKGRLKGFWAVEVSGNWRVIFKFERQDVTEVNYIDYH